LGEVVATPRSQDRALPLNTAVDNYVGSPRGTLPRERFSPMTHCGSRVAKIAVMHNAAFHPAMW